MRVMMAGRGWAVVVLLLLAAVPASGMKPQWGAGVYGVYGVPIVQDDVGSGPVFGAKAIARFGGLLSLEGSYTSFQEGDVTFDVQGQEQTLTGGTQTAICLNAVVGGTSAAGLGIYGTAGLGSYKQTKDFRDDVSGVGFNGGLGLEYRTSVGLAVDVGGRLHYMPLDDGGSRKYVAILAGVNYYFLK